MIDKSDRPADTTASIGITASCVPVDEGKNISRADMEAVGLRKRTDSYYLNIAYGETIDEVVQGAIEGTDKPMDVVAIEGMLLA